MLAFKKKVAPEWYTNGPVKTFTQEEINAYSESPEGKAGQAKAEEVRILGPEMIRYLDDLKLRDAEADFKDIMKGESPREDNVQS